MLILKPMHYLFGPFLALGFLIGSFIIWRKGKEAAYDEELIFDALILTTFWGLIGARLEFIFFNFHFFGTNFLKWIWLTQYAGLRFSGGLVSGTFGLFLFIRKQKWEFWPIADIAVFGLSLAQAIGKIGCFFNEFDWAQIFESTWLFLVYLLLLRLERRYRLFAWYLGKKDEAAPGFLALTYLIFYFLGRFLLDLTYQRNFVLSVLLIWLGLIGLYWRSGRNLLADKNALLTFAFARFNKLRYRGKKQ